jgi:hypothetical protein
LVLFFSHFLVLGQHVHAGVNEWLTIRNRRREIFKRLLICRGGFRRGSGGIAGVATSSGAGAAHKRQYQGNPVFASAVVFSPQQCRSKEKC